VTRLGRTVLAALLAAVLATQGCRATDRGARPSPPADLARAARLAAAAIRTHQSPGGFWSNGYTPGPVFNRPARETNISINAFLVELLEPIAPQTQLADVVERARGFLRRQVEASGLVRYHGRPEATSIRPRPCDVITPDADDTALVWRLAPPASSALLPAALDVLERFRSEDGLYRTWLAEPEDFQCLNPGRDPNPADIGINMHVYLLLARHDPGAARRLCAALRASIAEDRVWVYCEVAPLVQLLREVDLTRSGCPLRVPARRLQRAPAHQQPYLALAQLYRALLLAEHPPPSAGAVRRVLEELAAEDFKQLRLVPPLLYHNDLTASIPRFYWSRDVGYALWLRVLAAAARRFPRQFGTPIGPIPEAG